MQFTNYRSAFQAVRPESIRFAGLNRCSARSLKICQLCPRISQFCLFSRHETPRAASAPLGYRVVAPLGYCVKMHAGMRSRDAHLETPDLQLVSTMFTMNT